MLQLGNRETKTVTVTQNLMLELKYNTVNEKTFFLNGDSPTASFLNDNDFPGRAGHWNLHLPDRVSYLPRAVGQSLLSYLVIIIFIFIWVGGKSSMVI